MGSPKGVMIGTIAGDRWVSTINPDGTATLRCKVGDVPDLVAERDKLVAQVEELKAMLTVVSDKLEMCDIDCMGQAKKHGVQPWPVRDEVLHNINELLTRIGGDNA